MTFIDRVMAYLDGKGSPSIFRKWSGIFTTSAVLERKVWVRTVKGKLYPNQYVILCAPAGVGKSLGTNFVYSALEEVRTPETPLHLAPSSVTRASLIDNLVKAERRIVRPTETPPVTQFNSLAIVPNEFGVFLPSWESDFMSVLTDLWDCGRYAETRRTGNIDIRLPATQLNLFSATTPAHLNRLLPEGAWEEGFMSRVLLIYSGEAIHTNLFEFAPTDDASWKAIVAELRRLYKLFGEFQVEDDVKHALNEWVKSGGQPIPEHPKLMTYRIRRPQHLLKLMMVASASDNSDMVITLDHFAEALDWLLEVEGVMPDIFKSMKSGGDGRAIEECWHYVYTLWMKHKQPVPAGRVIAFLQERVPIHNIDRIIDVMERTELLKKQKLENMQDGYIPKVRTPS